MRNQGENQCLFCRELELNSKPFEIKGIFIFRSAMNLNEAKVGAGKITELISTSATQ